MIRQWVQRCLAQGWQWIHSVFLFALEWTLWFYKQIWSCYLGLCSVSLRFSKPSLEKLFAQSQAETFVANYGRFTVVYSVVCVVHIGHQVLRGGAVVLPTSFLLLSFLALKAGQKDAAHLRRQGRGFVLFVRAFAMLLGTSVTTFLVTNPISGWLSIVEVLVLKSGLLVQMCIAYGLPLFFRDNLALSVVESVVITSTVGPAFCRSLTLGDSNEYHELWYSLDQTALKVLEGMFGMTVHDTAVCPVEGSCGQLFAWLQVYFGIFVLNYLVWLRERAARRDFLIRECTRENLTPPDNARAMVRVLGVALIVHILVFVTLFGAVWRFWGSLLVWLDLEEFQLPKNVKNGLQGWLDR
ncbi:hypothetical protein BSKO_09773 [Bryopsis sp. KO-2023]|nr:hypothetical protein BSKO_09773 [Bryopsis sp. KO-2023]